MLNLLIRTSKCYQLKFKSMLDLSVLPVKPELL